MAVKTGSKNWLGVERLVRFLSAWATNGASRVPAWLRICAKGGITALRRPGLPNMKQEAWRFTSVAPIAEGTFRLEAAGPCPDARRHPAILLLEAGYRLVFVDGFFTLSLDAFLRRCQSLAHVVTHRQDLVRPVSRQYAATQDRPSRAEYRGS